MYSSSANLRGCSWTINLSEKKKLDRYPYHAKLNKYK